MKKAILLAGLVAVALTSCSKDDDSIDKSKLLKKWYYVSYKYAGQTIPYDDNEVCGKDYFEFMADGVGSEVDVYGCDPYQADTMPATWSVSGNKLTINEEGDVLEGTITKLTTTTLEVKLKYDFDGDGTLDTFTEVLSSVE